MIWIIGFIILVIIGSLGSSTGSSNRSDSTSRSTLHNNRRLKVKNDSLSKASTHTDIGVQNKIKDQEKNNPVKAKEETYAEKHARINKAIEEKKRLELLEKAQNQKNSESISQPLSGIDLDASFPVEKRDVNIVNSPNNLLEEVKNTSELENSEAEFNDEDYVSTTKLGNIFGVKARPELFDYLVEEGCLTYQDKKYVLTDKGKSYGGYRTTKDKDGKFVVWNIEKTAPLLNRFLKNKLQNFEGLYHLTHESNVEGIFEKGLYCHSAKHEYKDISNTDVNQRREKIENCHGKKIHDYVPFYFNVKNAMLYAVQKKVETNVVVLEMDKMTACLPYTIFSDRNAATLDAKITNMKEDLKAFNWGEIYSDSWTENNIQNTSRMQFMMAECLILDKVPANFIKTVHCQDRELAGTILELARKYCLDINVKVTPQLFF